MPKKHPEPWFRKSTGKWYVQVQGKQIDLGPNEKEAWRLYHETMLEKPTIRSVSGFVTFTEVVDRYLKWVRANRSPETLRINEWRLQKLIDFIADPSFPAHKLTPALLSSWVDQKPTNKDRPTKAASTKRGLLMVVQTCFTWAVQAGIIDRSPISGMRKPNGERRESHATPEDFEAIIAACRHESLSDILTVAWETGMRPNELRVVDSNWLDGDKIVFPVKMSKGKRKSRVVYLTPKAKEICERLAKGGVLFRNSEGNPWTADALKCAMDRIATRTGKKLAMVDLRHGFATRKLKAGVGAMALAALMGHADGSMIAKHYSHIHEDADHLRRALSSDGKDAGR